MRRRSHSSNIASRARQASRSSCSVSLAKGITKFPVAQPDALHQTSATPTWLIGAGILDVLCLALCGAARLATRKSGTRAEVFLQYPPGSRSGDTAGGTVGLLDFLCGATWPARIFHWCAVSSLRRIEI